MSLVNFASNDSKNSSVTSLKPTDEDNINYLKQISISAKINVDSKKTRSNIGGGDIKTIIYTDENNNNSAIRVAEKKIDPFDPSRFRNRKPIKMQQDDPEPILSDPSKKLTREELEYWDIPPTISNWKNPSGHVIPMEYRILADGSSMQQTKVSDKFTVFNQVLNATSSNINKQAQKLAQEQAILRQKRLQEEEERLREEAKLLSQEKERINSLKTSEENYKEQAIRNHVKARKLLQKRMKNRDISEQVALGHSLVSQTHDDEFDQSVFKESGGLGHGFKDDESYSVYDDLMFKPKEEKQYIPFANAVDNSSRYNKTVLKKTGSTRISFKKSNTLKAIKESSVTTGK